MSASDGCPYQASGALGGSYRHEGRRSETDRKGADVGLTMMGSFALRSRSFGELSYAFVAGCQTLTSSHHTAAPTVHPSSPSSAISGIVCECVCREL
eukprot:3584455-Rhodomonas_salina.1